jgi:SnoaL-like domain
VSDNYTVVDDLEEIRKLKARYFRMMDSKNWDGLAAVFTEDVEIDMTGEGGGVTRGVGEYMPFLRDAIETVTTVHHGHMPEIELTSPSTAEGVWALVAGRRSDQAHARIRALPRDLREDGSGLADQDDDDHAVAPHRGAC